MILLSAGLIIAAAYKLTALPVFIGITLIVGGIAVTLAFVKINGQAFHFFLLNLIQTLRLPPLRLWNKNLTTEEILQLIIAPPPPKALPTPKKEPLSTTKLAELTLVVNTGGVYRPEEW